jgi:hypothetical protein
VCLFFRRGKSILFCSPAFLINSYSIISSSKISWFGFVVFQNIFWCSSHLHPSSCDTGFFVCLHCPSFTTVQESWGDLTCCGIVVLSFSESAFASEAKRSYTAVQFRKVIFQTAASSRNEILGNQQHDAESDSPSVDQEFFRLPCTAKVQYHVHKNKNWSLSRAIDIRFPAWPEILLCSIHVGSGARPSVHLVPAALFPGVKWPKLEADDAPT